MLAINEAKLVMSSPPPPPQKKRKEKENHYFKKPKIPTRNQVIQWCRNKSSQQFCVLFCLLVEVFGCCPKTNLQTRGLYKRNRARENLWVTFLPGFCFQKCRVLSLLLSRSRSPHSKDTPGCTNPFSDWKKGMSETEDSAKITPWIKGLLNFMPSQKWRRIFFFFFFLIK